MTYTVKQLAKLAGVSARTLHYYDEIGLLKPSFVKENGYRCYEEKEVLLLQQILFFRELEFPLEEIKNMVTAPHFNLKAALADHKRLLELKQERIAGLLHTIDTTIEHMKGGDSMNTKTLFTSFDDKQMEEYKNEAKKRWGNTDAYKQSVERTKHWTKADYERVAKEGAAWTAKLAELRERGFTIDSAEVQEMIGEHYNGLRTFYEPNIELYRGLGNMYVDDPRFTAYYEKFGKGLAVFMRDSMLYFADQQEK